MTSSNDPSTPPQTPSRKERRAAERAGRKTGTSSLDATSRSGPSLLIIGIAALVVGVAIALALVVASGGTGQEQTSLPAVSQTDVAAPPKDLRVGRSLGDPEAPVKVDVFEDPQCPACGLYTERIEPLLIAGPVSDGTVFLTYKDLPFLGPESLDAAVAMRVAEQLGGKFWDYHGIMFHNQQGENKGAFSQARLADMAELVGLERGAFLAEMRDPATYEKAVQAEAAEAATLGLKSTPSILVNGQLIPGGVPTGDDLSALIEAPASGAPASGAPGAG